MSDVKRYLNQVRYIDQNIRSRQTELDNIRKNIPSASNWKQDMVQESRQSKSFVDKLVKLDEEITEKIDELVEIREKVTKQISQLKTPESEIILRERYINMRYFSDIADLLNTSERQVKRLHGQSLVEFETLFQKEIDEFINKISKCP